MLAALFFQRARLLLSADKWALHGLAQPMSLCCSLALGMEDGASPSLCSHCYSCTPKAWVWLGTQEPCQSRDPWLPPTGNHILPSLTSHSACLIDEETKKQIMGTQGQCHPYKALLKNSNS